jgi:cell division septation protein DedD
MSSSKEYRELQFSSTQLVAVFLGVLAVGVIIFILGVSVGKKQGRLTAAAGSAAPAKTETLAEKKPVVLPETPTPPLKTEAAAAPGRKSSEGTPPETKTPAPSAAKPTDTAPAKVVPAKPTENKAADTKTKASPAPASPAKTGTYFVQVGASDDKATATVFARRIEKDGFPTLVLDPLGTDKKTVYRIRLGPYETKEAAEDARTKVAAALKKKRTDFFVVKG